MPVHSFEERTIEVFLGLCLWFLPFSCVRADALQPLGTASEVFQQLAAQELQRAGDPAFDAALGRAAYAFGDYPRAVMAWERVVVVQPDNRIAQMELSRALLAVGDKRGARALSGMVREQGVPVDAALDVSQFLSTYDRPDSRGASSVKVYAELAAGHDSNTNAGPDAGVLVSPLPGTPAWTLAPGAQATSASFTSALLAVRGRYLLDSSWSLVGAASASARRHELGARPYDNSQIDANAGVAWRREHHEIIVTGLYASQLLDGARVRSLGGVQGEWLYRFDGFRQWGGFVQWLNLRYPGQPLRNVQRSVAGASYSHVFRNGMLAYGTAYVGRESPDALGAESFGHHLAGWQLGGQIPLTSSLALFAALNGEHRHYGAVDPFFSVQRRDEQHNLSLGVSWIPVRDWRITSQWTQVQNDSSVPVSQYKRRIFSITVRREF